MELKQISREIVYKGRVLDVWVDQVEYPSGTRSVREVIHHPGGSAVLPLFEDGRILLVEQFRYPPGARLLELPAGRLETGEDPASTAARELEEETGWIAGSLEKLASVYSTPGFCDELVHIYLGRHLTRAATVQTKEEGELGLVVHEMTLPEALSKVQSGEIRDCKTILGLLIVHRQLSK